MVRGPHWVAAVLMTASCGLIQQPDLSGDYVLEDAPWVTLSVDEPTRFGYDYKFCDGDRCEAGEMHVVEGFNGFRGEAEFYGAALERLEDRLEARHDRRPGPLLARRPDGACIITFQDGPEGVTFLADPDADRRFERVPKADTDAD